MASSKKKKKQKRNLLLLVLVLVLLVACYFLVTFANKKAEEKKEEETASEQLDPLVGMEEDDVRSITVTSDENGELEFTRAAADSDWVLTGYEDMPIRSTMLTNLLSNTATLNPTNEVTQDLKDLASYGLEVPQFTVTVSTDSDSATFYVGNKNDYTGGYYVYQEGNDHVYLVSGVLYSALNHTAFDYCDETVTAFNSENAVEVKVTSPTGNFDLRKYNDVRPDITWCTALVWYRTDENGAEQVSDSEQCANYLEALSKLSAGDCVGYTDADTELESLGLTDLQATRLDLTVTNDDKEEVTTTYWISPKTEDGTYYFRSSDGKGVYKINAEDVDTVLAYTAKSFWNTGFSLVNIDTVNSLDVTIDGVTTTMSITREEVETEAETETDTETDTDTEGESESETETAAAEPQTETVCTYCINGEEVEEDTFKNVYRNIVGTYGERTFADGEEPVAVDPHMTIVFHTTLESFPEVTIQYTYYNSDYYEATVNGETRFLVNRNAISNMEEALNTAMQD